MQTAFHNSQSADEALATSEYKGQLAHARKRDLLRALPGRD